MKSATALLLILALLLHVADVATTLAGLRTGVADEGNPLNVALLRLGGPLAYAIGSTAMVGAALAVAGGLAWRWRRGPDPLLRAAPLVALVLLVALTAATVVSNLAVLHGMVHG